MEFIEVSINDLFRAKIISNDSKSEFGDRIVELIDENFSREEENYDIVKIYSDDLVYDYFVGLKINADILGLAFARAGYENNNEMKSLIKEFYYNYLDNIREGISNEIIEYKILENKKLINYIFKFNSLTEFSKTLKPRKNNSNKQHIKGKTLIE